MPVFLIGLKAGGAGLNLTAADTVEEKIQAMQARKADLARAVLEGGATQRLRFDEADLAELFAPL